MDKRVTHLLDLAVRHHVEIDPAVLQKAYSFAAKAHDGQKRHSGEPYINHPYHVAEKLITFGMDQPTVIAGLLHDVPEDTAFTTDDVAADFGVDVAKLVEGVTKLGKLKYRGVERYAENLRKLFLAMAEDIRVIIIRLADRAHNMQTLEHVRADKQKRIAEETLEIYAPIANRLGMGELKGELEDLAFPYIDHAEYERIKKLGDQLFSEKEGFLQEVTTQVRENLQAVGITPLGIESRAKHLYSLWMKLRRHDNDITSIYDLMALRIIVTSEQECYQALGTIHSHWRPMIGRIKDYIAQPKANGYQSLHTTVIGPGGIPVEFQIRTLQMHELAEYGVAAHWHYDEIKSSPRVPTDQRTAWINELTDWHKSTIDSEEYITALKLDVFKNRIFVFTPKGDVIELPEEATALDLAFHIHTEVGFQTVGAKINNKMSPLHTQLKSGDLVEIITDKKRTSPSRDWLTIARTNAAREKIRSFFRKVDRVEHVQEGKRVLNDALQKIHKPPFESLPGKKLSEACTRLGAAMPEDILVGLAIGEYSLQRIINALFRKEEILTPKVNIKQSHSRRTKKQTASSIWVDNAADIATIIAKCCKPEIGSNIVGLSTRRGIMVHNRQCPRLKSTKSPRIKTTWAKGEKEAYHATLYIRADNQIGVAAAVTKSFAQRNVNISSMQIQAIDEVSAKISVTAEMDSIEDLVALMEDIRNIPGCREVAQASDISSPLKR